MSKRTSNPDDDEWGEKSSQKKKSSEKSNKSKASSQKTPSAKQMGSMKDSSEG